MAEQSIIEALLALDPANDDHWTTDGLPAMAQVQAILETDEVTRRQVNDVAADFNRDVARQVKADHDAAASESGDPAEETDNAAQESDKDHEGDETPPADPDPEKSPEPVENAVHGDGDGDDGRTEVEKAASEEAEAARAETGLQQGDFGDTVSDEELAEEAAGDEDYGPVDPEDPESHPLLQQLRDAEEEVEEARIIKDRAAKHLEETEKHCNDLRAQVDKIFPKETWAEGQRRWLDTQQKLREARGRDLAKAAPSNKAPIDQAMGPRRGYGHRRPTFAPKG